MSAGPVLCMGQSGSVCISENLRCVIWTPTAEEAVPITIQLAEVTRVEEPIQMSFDEVLTVAMGENKTIELSAPRPTSHTTEWHRVERLLHTWAFIGTQQPLLQEYPYRKAQEPVDAIKTQASPFLKLPGELRNAIYSYAAEQIDCFGFLDGAAKPCVSGAMRETRTPSNACEGSTSYPIEFQLEKTQSPQTVHPLTQTSQQCRVEFQMYLEKHHLAAATLRLDVHNFDFRNAIDVLKTVPNANLRLISITLRMPAWYEGINWDGLNAWYVYLLTGSNTEENVTRGNDGPRDIIGYHSKLRWRCHGPYDRCGKLTGKLYEDYTTTIDDRAHIAGTLYYCFEKEHERMMHQAATEGIEVPAYAADAEKTTGTKSDHDALEDDDPSDILRHKQPFLTRDGGVEGRRIMEAMDVQKMLGKVTKSLKALRL
ncbi:hypothetical protein LTR36_008966 [Oleoguttula mirabilis]|uniref:Uncharacterized protein n=1 Tax=Oleoguttula mirabilis TaxID=1507867 RepID=A0AAV9J6X0_9PEZI|nr:hypothetical protein LTR36_008966 [Oleoguttula mirabilis]